MKREHVKPGRYVAKIGTRTIVRCYRNGSGWSFRDERTQQFVSLTARRLWRPAYEGERYDSETVTRHACATHRGWVTAEGGLRPLDVTWIGEETCHKSDAIAASSTSASESATCLRLTSNPDGTSHTSTESQPVTTSARCESSRRGLTVETEGPVVAFFRRISLGLLPAMAARRVDP